jgi:ribosomal protein S18 acetylase RimI-like enzyme
MNSPSVTVHPMTEAQLEAVIALDCQITGHSRRGFYTKQFAAGRTDPDGFVWLVAQAGSELAGFLLARLIDGDFGAERPAAVIEALGTAPARRGQGVARALLADVERRLGERGVSEIHSEADWTEADLVRFFATSGFQLAPVLVLDRPVTAEL